MTQINILYDEGGYYDSNSKYQYFGHMIYEGTTIYATTRNARTDQRGKDSLICKLPFDNTWSTLDSANMKTYKLVAKSFGSGNSDNSPYRNSVI